MLFKRELYITRDIKRYGEIADKLSQKGIKYTVSTCTFANAGRCHGKPFINSEAMYEYKIYVKRKDFDIAKQLL